LRYDRIGKKVRKTEKKSEEKKVGSKIALCVSGEPSWTAGGGGSGMKSCPIADRS